MGNHMAFPTTDARKLIQQLREMGNTPPPDTLLPAIRARLELEKEQRDDKRKIVRILIADDHSLARAGMRTTLGSDPELDVIDEAVDGAEAVAKARQLRPDLVLMDVRMPVMDGIVATSTIRNELPETQVVLMTVYESSDYIIKSIQAGAVGLLMKDVTQAELRKTVKAAVSGQVQPPPRIAAYLKHELPIPHDLELLTNRETEVLRLLARGYTDNEIAPALNVARDTVKAYIRHILSKLGVQNRIQAVVVAKDLGLISYNQGASK